MPPVVPVVPVVVEVRVPRTPADCGYERSRFVVSAVARFVHVLIV